VNRPGFATNIVTSMAAGKKISCAADVHADQNSDGAFEERTSVVVFDIKTGDPL
jgi:hypothetical protein